MESEKRRKVDRWLSKLRGSCPDSGREKHGLADTNLTSRRVIKGDDGAATSRKKRDEGKEVDSWLESEPS